MYEPSHFRLEDREALFALIRAHPLGTLITTREGALMANLVPFLLVETGEQAYLRAHVARPNPQWQEIAAGATVLVTFTVLDHYVSPGWYPSKSAHGKVVPTWNYQHIQIRGRARVDDSAEFLAPQIAALTHQHEAPRAQPWTVQDAPEAFVAAQMRGIVGIELAIDEIKGKFKLSQNRQAADHAGVIEGLAAEPDATGPEMAAVMRQQGGGAPA